MRKVKWGVLGTAYIFERDTAEGMKQAENCELYAIAGRSMEKAEGFREKYGFQKAYGSYEALLADDEVEAVYIPLPNTMHPLYGGGADHFRLCTGQYPDAPGNARRLYL